MHSWSAGSAQKKLARLPFRSLKSTWIIRYHLSNLSLQHCSPDWLCFTTLDWRFVSDLQKHGHAQINYCASALSFQSKTPVLVQSASFDVKQQVNVQQRYWIHPKSFHLASAKLLPACTGFHRLAPLCIITLIALKPQRSSMWHESSCSLAIKQNRYLDG